MVNCMVELVPMGGLSPLSTKPRIETILLSFITKTGIKSKSFIH